MSRQQLTVRFGAADTATGEKHQTIGKLVTATNVSMPKRGTLSKRPAFASTQITYSGGSLGTPTEISELTDGSINVRDNLNQLWSISGTAGTLTGTHERPWAEHRVVAPAEVLTCRPRAVEVGANTWYFSCNGDSTANYYLTIYNTATGALVVPSFTVALTGGYPGVRNIAPVYDGTNVWAFIAHGGTQINCHKFTVASPTSAPTQTTYLDVSGTSWTSVDAKWMPGANGGAGRAYVVAVSGNTSGSIDRRTMFSYLNAGTGAATSPTYYNTTATSLANCSGSISILDGQDGSEASWYFVECAWTTITLISLVKVASVAWTATRSQSVTTWPNGPHIASGLTTTTHHCASIVSGFCSSATAQVIYAQAWSMSSANASYLRNDELTVWSHTATNGTLDTPSTATAISRGSWMASKPFKVGSTWYILTGFDDGVSPTTAYRQAQQGYYLRNATTGAILAQVAPTEGAATHHIEATVTTGPIYTTTPRPIVSGTKAYIPITVNNSNIAYCAGGVVEIDFAKEYGKSCVAMGRTFSPGPIPVAWASGVFHEVAPLLWPYYATFNTVSTADYGVFAARYVIVDPDGTQWRGAPLILVQSITAGSVVTLPTLRHQLPGTTVRIEIYLGLTSSATPKLQTSIASSTTAHSTTYTIPAVAAYVAGETLDAFGGGIAQTWPQPCTCVAYWRGRVLLGHDKHIHFSQELAAGFGPKWNASSLTTTWEDAGDREIIAMAPINWDYFAVFTQYMIGALSGPGPDGLGRGNYVVQTVATMTGTVDSFSVVQGPDGCYFADASAGRLCLINPSLRVSDVEGLGRGSFPATSSASKFHGVWWEGKRCMLVVNAGTIYVVDYGNRTEEFPQGRMYLWTVAGWNTVALNDTGPGPSVMSNGTSAPIGINPNGDIYRPSTAETYRGNQSSILRVVKTAPIQPADLLGEFDVAWIKAIVTRSDDCSVEIKVFPGYSSTPSETATMAISSTVEQAGLRPAGCARISAVAIQFSDTSTGNVNGGDLDGFVLEINSRGRAKMLNSGQVL